MKRCGQFASALLIALFASAPSSLAAGLDQPLNTWVKLSPLGNTPPAPRLGYEGACAWDSVHHRLIRYGGHNQGGGGEQHAEVWTFDPLTAKWELKEPNTSPVGICCGQQNVFDPIQGRYLRFPAFSGSHGWQWWREIYLNDASVWSYDLASNVWRNLRPLPTPTPRPLRCASWDSDHQVVVMFGGEGSNEGTLVYDPYANTWTRMNPPAQPASRSGGNMAYDDARKLHILFGAQFTDDPRVWAYDLRRNEWRDLKPPTLPLTDKNDAVLTYDPIGKVVLALVKISEGKDEEAKHRLETWAFDTAANHWTKMNPEREPDPSGNRARVLSFAPELNVAILENRTHSKDFNEQQIWAYRFAARPSDRQLLPPTHLQVTTDANRAMLTWTSSSSANVTHYEIYRGEGDQPWKVDYQRIATIRNGEKVYRDAGLKSGKIYCYFVRAVAAGQSGQPAATTASADTIKVRTQPRVVEDLIASVVSPRRVELSWLTRDTNVMGYFIERATVEMLTEDQLKRLKKQTLPLSEPSAGAIQRIGQFRRITGEPVKGTTFSDDTIDVTKPATVNGEPIYQRTFNAEQFDTSGKPYRFAVYAYRVRAVNALGMESGPSPACFTIPSAPQWFFTKEEGAACQFKWAANPEKGIKGYRVYRMDGRYDTAQIPRLTAEPIAAMTYRDPTAGRLTRRYHVVAVDALGQEGFPSAPVWFEREWKKFYVPFTGEWHQ